MPFDEIILKIKEKSGLSDDEIRKKIDEKVSLLSGLVSKEGAAHIVANELGIKLFDTVTGRLQIKNVLSGLRDVEVLGKVLAIYDVKSFNSSGREGKVGSIQIADDTGQIRVVLWNNMADNISKIKIGDFVKVKSGYVRDRPGGVEIHMNDRARLIVNPEGETVNVASVQAATTQTAQRINLAQIAGASSQIEVFATVVQIFEPRYFEVCPTCGKRAKMAEGLSACDVHGAVTPAYSYVVNAFIDDGTESVRAVFFREQAQRLLNTTHEEILKGRESPDVFEKARNDVLGSTVKIIGRPSKNDMFDRVELVANQVFLNPDLDPEIARLEEEVKQLRDQKQ